MCQRNAGSSKGSHKSYFLKLTPPYVFNPVITLFVKINATVIKYS